MQQYSDKQTWKIPNSKKINFDRGMSNKTTPLLIDHLHVKADLLKMFFYFCFTI